MDEKTMRALLERLAETEQPASQVDVALARRQGRRRLRWRLTGVVGVPLAVVVAGVAVVASGTIASGAGASGVSAPRAGGHGDVGIAQSGQASAPSASVPAVPVPPPTGWVQHTARSWPQASPQGPPGAVSIDAPAAWHFNSNPTPRLISPTTLFAVGTGRVPAGGSCAPTAALSALRANGALLVLTEYSQDDYTYSHAASQPGFPPRRGRLRLGRLSGPYECWGVKGYLIRFEDGGRYFQAQVEFGPHASAALRAKVERSLNTLHVAPAPAH
jgi:hypothetical protein